MLMSLGWKVAGVACRARICLACGPVSRSHLRYRYGPSSPMRTVAGWSQSTTTPSASRPPCHLGELEKNSRISRFRAVLLAQVDADMLLRIPYGSSDITQSMNCSRALAPR